MGKWFWEVVYRDSDGKDRALRSSVAFEGSGEAFLAYNSIKDQVGVIVEKLNGTLILQEHIIYAPDFPNAILSDPL